MSELMRQMLRYAAIAWDDLTTDERKALHAWARRADGELLHMLLRHARGRWSRRSSSTQMSAVRGDEDG